MAVRLRLRIKRNSRVIEVVALLNSGYEADSPQLMVPISVAEKLCLWPPPSSVHEEVFDFAKGYWRFRWEPKEKIRMSEKKTRI